MTLPLAAALIVGVVTSVTDGDTFRIGQVRARIAGTEANELRGGCHLTVCPTMPGPVAKRELERLILGKEVTCEPVGKSYRRVVAWCWVDHRPLSCETMRRGISVRWARYWPASRTCNERR